MIGFILRLAATGLPLLTLTGSAAWVSYAVVKRRRGEAPARRAILWTLLAATVATLLAWTLFLGNPSRADSDRVNLTPFREILRGVRVIGSDYGVINIWGNLLVFVPLGVLVTLLWRGRWRAERPSRSRAPPDSQSPSKPRSTPLAAAETSTTSSSILRERSSERSP